MRSKNYSNVIYVRPTFQGRFMVSLNNRITKIGNISHTYLIQRFQKYARNRNQSMTTRGSVKMDKKVLLGALNWLSYLDGSSEINSEMTIFCVFLQVLSTEW